MTELEAAQNFKIEVNKLDRSSLVDVRFEKIIHYLNKASLFLVKSKYNGEDPGPGRLEVNHPVTDDLKVLTKVVSIDASDGFVPFADDHLYYIDSKVETMTPECNDPVWAKCRYVKADRVNRELESPFTKTQFDDPVCSILDNKLYIYQDGFTLGDVEIKYLGAPRTITGIAENIMELPFADEIIDTAATMAIENFESDRIKTQPAINVASIE